MNRRTKSKSKAPRRARAKTTQIVSSLPTEPLTPDLGDMLVPEIGIARMHGRLGRSGLDLDSIRRDREALAAELRETLEDLPARYLSELRRVGVDQREVAIHLSLIGQAGREKVKSLTTVPGVPISAIRKLPELLRKVGHQVSAINKHRVLQSIFLWRRREGLPGSLYSYARALEEKLSAQKGRTVKTREPGTAAKVQFVQYVLETSTDRKQHYRAIAELINAFNEVQDWKYDVKSKQVTAASLKQLWLEHKDLRKTPAMAVIPPIRIGPGITDVTFSQPRGKLS